MEYLTQGTIQVELTGTAIQVRINPIQNFIVKHNGKDYIVFMPDSMTARMLDLKAFEKTQSFSAPPDLASALTDVAVKETKIEIKINDPSTRPKAAYNIASIKIPATG
jgi:hypothetical protein